MTDPVSRTILLLDIERFSDRDDVEQAYLRRMLYDITDRALEAAGIDGTRRLRADRGDSVMELIDAGAPVTALLRALLREVPAQLRQVNRMSSRSAQIRLRGVVAAGYVAVDGHDGWVGSDLNHACRLLDADVLRAALRERHDDFALCVSESVHAGIVRHDHPGIPAEDFHAVTVASKNGPLRAWLHGPLPAGVSGAEEGGTAAHEVSGTTASTATTTAAPQDHSDTGAGEAPVPGDPGDGPAPGQQAPPRAQPPGGVVLNFLGGSPSFGGSLVAGDQHGVSGGQVTGDVHLGRSGGEPA
ncbi:hypothetical protein [Streptomyces sp. PSKA30]|uniref:hypothetical protein n=1 Tax=Streptomyces sp. PSKA30 TaxID=2874597 RepID=UPI001CD19247|nr:hypothetical protein [Streptomyces sp. PSKA30]MBZ9643014.1 hypothetical protein [Streptomyces sp. PSKA30]